MQPKTEELIYFLFWSLGKFSRPTFRNLNESFESWAYRQGFSRQLAVLEKARLVERQAGAPGDRLYRLTAHGCLHGMGGCDPQSRWSRPWDGRWRLVLFDIPRDANTHRVRLRRHLRARGFGHLQNSLWITPDSMEEQKRILTGGRTEVESLILMEARPCAGERDAEIVAGAWDFDGINRRYARHGKILDEAPQGRLSHEAAAKTMRRWASAEREAWLEAVTADPLLPERLLPDGYPGMQSWKRRIETLRRAWSQLRTFHP